jgi:hypothetical protein
MKVDKNDSKSEATNLLKEWVEKWEKKGFVKRVIDGFTYFFPPLVK